MSDAAKGLLGRLNEVLHEAAAAVLRAWGFEEMRDLTTDADHTAPPVGSFNPDEWEPHSHSGPSLSLALLCSHEGSAVAADRTPSVARIPPGVKGVNVVQEKGPVGGVPEPGGLPPASSAAYPSLHPSSRRALLAAAEILRHVASSDTSRSQNDAAELRNAAAVCERVAG